MELMVSNFIIMLLHDLVSSGFVEILGNTYTSILNRQYHEEAVIVRNKLECTMFCVHTELCEAFYYDTAAAEDSKCLLRKYITSILYPLIIDTSLPSNTSVMFLQKHGDYCVVPPDYQFEQNLLFWYKVVVNPKLSGKNAREACRQNKAYLLLIDDANQYSFARDLLVQYNEDTVYTQGTRKTSKDPYLNENGNIMTYHDNWNTDGIQGSGNYIRVAATGIETSSGTEINSLLTAYIQGVRATANDPFLDEIERQVTYEHWGNGGVGGPGNYMRLEKSWIETSTGTTLREYICQLRLK